MALLGAAAVPATVAGVVFALLAETAARDTAVLHPEWLQWLVLLPVAALLFLGVGAAIDAAQQSYWNAACLRTNFPTCQPGTPTLFLGSVLWIVSGVVLLCGAALAGSGSGRIPLVSKPVTATLTVLLGGNLVLGTTAWFLSLQPALYEPATWILIRILLLLYITAGLVWAGAVTCGGFAEGEWAFAARLLGWMNLVPTSFIAVLLGLEFLQGAWPPGL